MTLLSTWSQSIGSRRLSKKRLGVRVVLAMAIVMAASSLLFLVLFAPAYRQSLLREREAISLKLSAVLQASLQRAMLRRDLDSLREMVLDLGQTPDVSLVMILDSKGEARFSSNQSLLGKIYKFTSLCPTCSENSDEKARSGFLQNENGRDVMRSIRPVPNQRACTICHGPIERHPINGYLVIDYSANDLKNQTWTTALALAGAGLLVIAGALAATWATLQRFVLVPVETLAHAVRNFGHTDRAPHLPVKMVGGASNDEIADLAQNFDMMAVRVETAMEDVRKREAFQQALIDAIPDGVRVITPDYRVISANSVFCEQAGLSLDDVLSKPCYASSHGRTEPCVPTLVVCPLKRAGVTKCSHTHVNHKTGVAFAAEVVAAPLNLSRDSATQQLIVESVRYLSRQVLISQEQRLSELGQLAAGVAHEIHNPLASIRLGVHAIQQKLSQTRFDNEAEEFLSAVNVEVDRCLQATGRLIKLGRAPEERGGLVNVDLIAADTAALLRYDSELRGIATHVVLSGDARIIANDSDIGMILLNLMQNAMHAMPKGGLLTIIAEPDDDDIRIIVRDTGIGIDPENIESIFHPFWSARSDGSTGSGLGLAICKSLVTKWGGSIRVKSILGQGSDFIVIFPNADKAINASGKQGYVA